MPKLISLFSGCGGFDLGFKKAGFKIVFSNDNEKKLEEAKIKNPRVGTIDKFQGQEAPITIISMTSSDSDSLPRNKEFFFSRNRLNVAISRAQVASIILFNPQLLDSSPKNLDQIKLMNNFFKLIY